ncbi:hypothetical protein HS088_TW08G00206 [Tripterygium wilfordii]|uniref:Phytocyanin domain-containing protein n=1 Tax=Tripterygium wilfordii TaxID=458696 RepID=A0A7J7DBD7_TRIWF|nr:mavicyanin-like [Tripterygium wilfordii]KAF5743621.1 hypothetical protein HS088_TW08G00206 [Tripterygium wilfordii]
MAKLLLVIYVNLILAFALTTCHATNYVVGDTSGWDISSDLDTWAAGKTFTVGDTLVFQYSSNSDLCELSRDDFERCNTSNPIKTYSNGNTTVTLTRPGEWYFSDANRLYCLGGMKLQVNVEDNQTAASPAGAPQAPPGTRTVPPSSSKNNNPSSVVPTSTGSVLHERESAVMAFLIGFSVATISIVFHI